MNRRLVILGFMACGKTTVARELARQLGCEFIDLDSFITERHGRSPARIIQEDGEEIFRATETLALSDVLQKTDARVIALGGGTWTVAANRTLIALHDCATVWLDTPFEVCWERIAKNETVRPLAPDWETAALKFDSRRADYSLAERTISVAVTDTVEKLAQQISSEM
jgi:shikimate kinase